MQIRLVKGRINRIEPKTIFQVLLALIWIQNTIWPFVERILAALPLVAYVHQYIFPSLLVATALLSLPYTVKKVRTHDVLFCLGAVSLVLLSYLLYSKNQQYIETYFYDMLISSLPLYLLGVCCSYGECRNTLYWSSLASVAVLLVYQMYLLSAGDYLGAYNMSASYKILPSVMYLISWAMNRSTFINWGVAAFGIFLSFSYGTRGPILAIFVFLFAGACISMFKSKKTYVKVSSVALTAVLLLIASSERIVVNAATRISLWFSQLGLSTRIFDYFINGEIAYDNGRNLLKDTVQTAIYERPLLGHGIMGDRVLLGTYVHNLPLELWCHFGVLFGTVFLIALVGLAVLALFKSRGKQQFVFVGMFVCFVFIKLMFSGSYLIEPYFFFMIGLFVNVIRQPVVKELGEEQ